MECFPGNKTEQLHRAMEKKELGNPVTVIIHVGANDMRATRKLDFVMGEVYALSSTRRRNFRTADFS